jgi:hypothetical protein
MSNKEKDKLMRELKRDPELFVLQYMELQDGIRQLQTDASDSALGYAVRELFRVAREEDLI